MYFLYALLGVLLFLFGGLGDAPHGLMEKVREFEEWSIENGGELRVRHEWFDDFQGTGLVATEDIMPGQSIVVAPGYLWFDPGQPSHEDMGLEDDFNMTDIFGLSVEDPVWMYELAIRVLFYLDDPAWKPWLDTLARDMSHLPGTWSDEDINLLGEISPIIQTGIYQFKRLHQSSFVLLKPHLLKFLPAERVTEEMWLWVMAVITSRSFPGGDDKPIVFLKHAAWIEKFNHHATGESTLEMDEDGRMSLAATRKYKVGDQVFVKYFEEPQQAEGIFQTYGMVLEAGKGVGSFSVEMQPNIDKSLIRYEDPNPPEAARIWMQLEDVFEFPLGKHWNVVEIGVNSSSLLRFCRGMSVNTTGRLLTYDEVITIVKGQILSDQNEIDAARTAVDILAGTRDQLLAKLELVNQPDRTDAPLQQIRNLHRLLLNLTNLALGEMEDYYWALLSNDEAAADKAERQNAVHERSRYTAAPSFRPRSDQSAIDDTEEADIIDVDEGGLDQIRREKGEERRRKLLREKRQQETATFEGPSADRQRAQAVIDKDRQRRKNKKAKKAEGRGREAESSV
mmetsp:Transcript_43529/g.78262  ORF Transcript_43529/g.78262 Transcript_43529/m.78262 type:complete len:565 (+) Transcript_43529:26-1720(+)